MMRNGEGPVGSGREVMDRDYGIECDRSVYMGKLHRARIARVAGFPADGGCQPFGVDFEKHDVGAAADEGVCRQVHLLCGRAVNESLGCQGVTSVFTARLRT